MIILQNNVKSFRLLYYKSLFFNKMYEEYMKINVQKQTITIERKSTE